MISQNNKNNKCFSKEYWKYSKYLMTMDIVEETRDWRLKHIRGFDNYMRDHGISTKNLSAINIYNYMESIKNLKPRTRENRDICIRKYIDYLYENHKTKISGKQVLPKIVHNSYSTTPSHYDDEEVINIIKSVDKDDNLSKRDYAILLIFISYGIRLKDLINLSYENIKWNDNKIIIRQKKDNEINEFPLTEEIRYAILDYLKNERFKIKLPYIFLTNAGRKISPGACYNIVNKYFKKANIKIGTKHHGPHSLRHSLATSLLDDGNGITDISGVLGHNQIETTMIYTRINFKELKKISLEVPTWKN